MRHIYTEHYVIISCALGGGGGSASVFGFRWCVPIDFVWTLQ